MARQDDPHIVPLVKGLTRPAMYQGVPMTLVIAEISLVWIVFIQTGNLLMLLLIVPLHALFYWLTVQDMHFANILRTRAFRYRPWRDNASFNP